MTERREVPRSGIFVCEIKENTERTWCIHFAEDGQALDRSLVSYREGRSRRLAHRGEQRAESQQER